MLHDKTHPLLLGVATIALGYTPSMTLIGLVTMGVGELRSVLDGGARTVFAVVSFGLLQSALFALIWVVLVGWPLLMLRRRFAVGWFLTLVASVLTTVAVSMGILWYWFHSVTGPIANLYDAVLVHILIGFLVGFFGGLGLLPNNGFNRTPESSGPAEPGKSGGGAG